MNRKDKEVVVKCQETLLLDFGQGSDIAGLSTLKADTRLIVPST